MRDFRDPVVVLSVITLTALLAVTGPFGSYLTLDFGQRLAFWVPINLIGSIIGLVIGALVATSGLRLNDLKVALLSALLAAVVMAAPFYALIDHLLVPFGSALWGLLEAAIMIFFAHLGICSLRKAWQADAAKQADETADQMMALGGKPAFVALLPAEVQGEVELISGRDHYIDIETDRGRASLLMRFNSLIPILVCRSTDLIGWDSGGCGRFKRTGNVTF